MLFPSYVLKLFYFSIGLNPESSQSVGLLEMGGASAQITFLPEGDPLANMFPVKLNGVDYKLYAHSYLAYGIDYAENWLAQYLWKQQGHPSSVDFPCMFKGGFTIMTSSNGTIFHVTGHLCGKFTGHRWILRSKASAAKLWCFPWSTPEQTI